MVRIMFNRIKLLVLLFSFLLFIFSCGSPSVIVKVRKPAVINTSGINTVAIMAFEGPGRSGAQAAGIFSEILLREAFYKIIERDQLSRIMKEQALGLTGAIDDSTAAEVGKLVGADALILGEITAYSVEDERGKETIEKEFEKKDKDGNVTKEKRKIEKYFKIRHGTVSITFRLVDVETGEVRATRSKTKKFSKKIIGDTEGEISEEIIAAAVKSIFGLKKKYKLKSKDAILVDLTRKVISHFIPLISPHYVLKKRIFAENESDQNKLAI